MTDEEWAEINKRIDILNKNSVYGLVDIKSLHKEIEQLKKENAELKEEIRQLQNNIVDKIFLF